MAKTSNFTVLSGAPMTHNPIPSPDPYPSITQELPKYGADQDAPTITPDILGHAKIIYTQTQITEMVKVGTEDLVRSLEATDDPRTPYDPLLYAVRSKSHGYVHRTLSQTTQRVMHLQSTGECRLHDVMDRSRAYINFREAFALPLGLTLALAQVLEIRHPYNRFEKAYAQMSIDFLCTTVDGRSEALDFKMHKDEIRPRVQEKMRLAATSLAYAGVTHQVITERHLPQVLTTNLAFLRPFAFDAPVLAQAKLIPAAIAMRQILNPGKLTVYNAARQLAAEFRCVPAELVQAAFYMIARYHWAVDLRQPLNPNTPIQFVEGTA